MDGINKKSKIIKNILSQTNFDKVSTYFKNNKMLDLINFDEFGRKLIGDQQESILKEYSAMLLPQAKEYFGSQTMIPSYSLFAEYSDKIISLHKHKDANACTYTIDLVLYQNSPWGIFVNGKEFLLNPNEALLFMGEENEHWRETRINNTDRIGVIFFHYVEPDHWYFTKGPEHFYEVIKNKNIY